jgi:uncharacterized protein (TIGR02391 family)
MRLERDIRPQLWEAVSNTYTSKNYTHAIVDAMHYLSELMREKTGFEGDGSQLIGHALGGDNPRLRVNKLQTESEKSVQRGLVQLLAGMYSVVRNPRHHDHPNVIEDTQNTADAIIGFIDYLVGVLDQSTEPFTLQVFVERVLDSYFVKSEEYAELLVSEIPPKRHLDTLIELYRLKRHDISDNLKFVFSAIFKRLDSNQLNDFCGVVSDELKTTTDEVTIRLNLKLMEPEFWSQISTISRLRIEHILIESIEQGEMNEKAIIRGALGTWARDYLSFFTDSSKEKVAWALLRALEHHSETKRRYILHYFTSQFQYVMQSEYMIERLITRVAKLIEEKDEYVLFHIYEATFPADWTEKLKSKVQHLRNDEGKLLWPKEWDMNEIPF